MTQIYQDENKIYQFDFSSALWSSNMLQQIFHANKAEILCDVDFIIETHEEILLIKYKNADVPGAVHPEAFQPLEQKREQKIARKYYDSWIYLTAIRKNKPVTYIYILEYPNSDAVMRKRIRNHIADLLPFQLQKLPEIQTELIRSFDVLSIAEWNAHSKYRFFPITPVNAGR